MKVGDKVIVTEDTVCAMVVGVASVPGMMISTSASVKAGSTGVVTALPSKFPLIAQVRLDKSTGVVKRLNEFNKQHGFKSNISDIGDEEYQITRNRLSRIITDY